ncbi:hypothetical protein ACHAW6_012612 [Cyclotella cf. meneghiniana]
MAPLDRFKYVRLKLNDFPKIAIEQYKLGDIATNDRSVFIECRKCIYGLPQAGILANMYLGKCLNEFSYHQSKFNPGLWSHKMHSIQFSLFVDDFGGKYVYPQDIEHLTLALSTINPETGKPMFEISVDKTASRFIGLSLDWDYET